MEGRCNFKYLITADKYDNTGRDSNVTGVSRVGEKRRNERNKSCSPGWAFEAGGGKRWQAEGRFLLLLKEEIILRYKITALPRCSFGLSPSSPSSSIHPRTQTTNTNLKAETTSLTASLSSHEESCYRLTNKIRMTIRSAEKRIFSFYEASRSWPLGVT